MKNKEKFLIIGLIVLMVVLLIVCCVLGDKKPSNGLSNNPQVIYENAQKESEAVKENERKTFIEIDIDKYLEYYSSNDNKLVLLAKTSCQYCQIAAPILQNISYNYNIDIYYVDTAKMEGDDFTKLQSSDSIFAEGFGTPMLLNLGNNKIIDEVDGLTDTAHYIEFFKKNGYIK